MLEEMEAGQQGLGEERRRTDIYGNCPMGHNIK